MALPSPFTDTAPDTRERQLALTRGLSKPERLLKTIALTALMRTLTQAGAERHAGAAGACAVRQRFLEQLYGHDMTPALRDLISRL